LLSLLPPPLPFLTRLLREKLSTLPFTMPPARSPTSNSSRRASRPNFNSPNKPMLRSSSFSPSQAIAQAPFQPTSTSKKRFASCARRSSARRSALLVKSSQGSSKSSRNCKSSSTRRVERSQLLRRSAPASAPSLSSRKGHSKLRSRRSQWLKKRMGGSRRRLRG
jgi:hypothetical protein